jgi:hypothetical protein
MLRQKNVLGKSGSTACLPNTKVSPARKAVLSQSLGFSLFEFEPFQPFLLFPFFPFLPFLPFLPQALLGLSLGLGSLGGGLFLKPFLQSLLSLALLSLPGFQILQGCCQLLCKKHRETFLWFSGVGFSNYFRLVRTSI